jgi:dihydrofolate synthase / folylpolyglutamate synthase
LERARRFGDLLGVDLGELHPLVVVGSKGKGTTATFAAAAAFAARAANAAWFSVGLITSPGYRSHRERIRLDGEAIGEADFAQLARRVARAVAALPPRSHHGGYLSPTGAFTIAGLTWLVEQGCDALVVEAGMGGVSDESSLTEPSVVAVTEIFEEHLGVLGDDLTAIATDKAGAICRSTRTVVSLPQEPGVQHIVETAAAEVGARLDIVPTISNEQPESGDDEPGESPGDHSRALPALPTALLRSNARLGLAAATRYLQVLRRSAAPAWHLQDVLSGVRLPGRLSVHRRDGQTWVVDSAISPPGLLAALEWCRHTVGEPSTVLLAIPDTKNLAACVEALGGLPVRLVSTDATHITFSAPGGLGEPARFRELDTTELGDLVLALGTISFVGEVLELLDVDVTRLF